MEPKCQPCHPECSVFDRVVVSYLIRGGARVSWELLPTFTDRRPLTFQLQVGTTSNPYADDWQDVGLPVTDAYFAEDPEQRVFGKTNWTHYRVQLTTSLGVYYSTPVGLWGLLNRRDLRHARNIVRLENLSARLSAQNGWLLKRRVTGQLCRRCLDFQTREVRDPDCPDCYGTGYECGYYYPLGCVWAAFQPRSYRVERDAGAARATVNDVVVKARMLLTDLMGEEDVWVADKSDERYYVHRINNVAEIRGVPIIGDVEMRPVPYSSIIYSIEIPGQGQGG